jgi:hypothetical protein
MGKEMQPNVRPQEMRYNEVWNNGSQISVNQFAKLKRSNEGSSPL